LGVGFSLSVVRILRFLGLSPLNVRGLTILGVCEVRVGVGVGVGDCCCGSEWGDD
jgi:hypothetical protein